MKKIIRFDGAKLQQYRKGLNLTQYDLAPMIWITQNRVSDIERNVTDPSPEEIEAFASALNVKVSDFLSDEKEIVVITNTFTKGKKQSGQEQQELFEEDAIDVQQQSKQLDLFVDEDFLARDLTGYVIIKKEDYQKLIECQNHLQWMMDNLSKGGHK